MRKLFYILLISLSFTNNVLAGSIQDSLNIILVQIKQEADEQVKKGCYDKAEQLWDEIFKILTLDNDLSGMILTYRHTIKDKIGTILLCEKIVNKYPNDFISIIAFVNMGDMYFDLKEHDKALKAYSKAELLCLALNIHGNAYYGEAIRGKAKIYGISSEAVKEYEKLIDYAATSDVPFREDKNMVNLINNYSDYNCEPLRMYANTKVRHTWDTIDVKNNIYTYDSIITLYPGSKLIPYICFLYGEAYDLLSRMTGNVIYYNLADSNYSNAYNYDKCFVIPESRYNVNWPILRTKVNVPIYVTSLNRLANLYLFKHSAKAVELFEEILKDDNVDSLYSDIVLNARLQLIYIYSGELDGYKEFMNVDKLYSISYELLNVYPNDPNLWSRTEACRYLAKSYVMKKQYNDAVKSYDLLLKKYFTGKDWWDYDFIVEMGEVYMKHINNNPTKVISFYKKYLSSKYPLSVRLSAQFYIATIMGKNNYPQKEIINAYRSVIKLNPKGCINDDPFGYHPEPLPAQAKRIIEKINHP